MNMYLYEYVSIWICIYIQNMHICINVYNIILAQSYPTLCDPIDCSMPGFPISWNVLRLMSIESVMPSNHLILCIPFSSCLQSFPASGSFPMNRLFTSGGQSIGASASTSVLPMNIQDWFPLRLTGWISLQSKGLLRVFSNTTVQSINSSVLSLLYGPILIIIHGYWKNHSFGYMDICWQSNVSTF